MGLSCRKTIHADNLVFFTVGPSENKINRRFLTADSTKPLTRTAMGFGGGGDGYRGNLKNAIIAFLAPLPSILFYLSFLNRIASTGSEGDSLSDLPPLWTWCYHHPLLLANALFFLNVNVLFWIIGNIQNNHWVRCFLSFSLQNYSAASILISFRLIVDFCCLV